MISNFALVTFVIPCYRLAHFLAECVGSVLSQTYPEIEIIILDDQSPDDTEAVAHEIVATQPGGRISYVKNPENLGNIRNYNKGIGLASGKYVWILSPDDRLRSPHIVERYVQVFEARPDVGFAFCPAHLIRNGVDQGLHAPSVYRPQDEVLTGPELVKDIAESRFELIAASTMIRKECYERITLFPVEMPHRGDSYVWALIAMRYAVAYFGEAMVDYRVHDLSMMSTLAREQMARIVEDDIAVPWRVKAGAEALGRADMIVLCVDAIVASYRNAVRGVVCRGCTHALTVSEVDASLEKWEPDPERRKSLRRRLARRLYVSGVGDLGRGDLRSARRALATSYAFEPALRFRPPIGDILGRVTRPGRHRI